jgi:hypothetical protein
MWSLSSRWNRSAVALAFPVLTIVAAASSEPAPKLLLWERETVDKLLSSAPGPWNDDAKFGAIVRALATGYPNEFAGIEFPAGKAPRISFKTGDPIVYDDGKEKTIEQKLEDPDLEDTFSQVYPLTNPTDKVPEDFDPGRFRSEPMFFALYGANETAVRAGCVQVDFCGQKVTFSKRCGAADALGKVSNDLMALFNAQPELAEYARNLGGTLNWRKVAGTQRLSNHSFAGAIDLNLDKSTYWRWQPAAKLPTFSRRSFPQPIIETFEQHGFIWGGKWYHYDTMHFEYRPELIAFAKAQAKNAK